MIMRSYLTYALITLSAIAASLAFLPYGWAHIASGAIIAGIGAVHALPVAANGMIKLAARVASKRT